MENIRNVPLGELLFCFTKEVQSAQKINKIHGFRSSSDILILKFLPNAEVPLSKAL
jgi:hypothetical protein